MAAGAQAHLTLDLAGTTVKDDARQLTTTEPPSAGGPSVRAEILAALSACLGVPVGEIDPAERFHRYGLDSLRATRLTGELSARLGRSLPSTTLWDHPTVDALVDHLTDGGPRPRRGTGPEMGAPASEPVAIVGLACRLPGARDARAAWELLASGVDAVSEVPADRWPVDRYFDADAGAPGKMSTRWGGFLDEVDRFDAGFFKISPREAAEMDPQQRLALELAWEALEDAGIAPSSLENSRTGVFFGQMWSDYLRLAGRHVEAFTPHTATGQDTSIIAARVSYTLGLCGPNMVVNTACSSALVAVHLACQSLLRGESALALVGGVNLLLSPETTILMTKFGAMAKDGRSKAFGTGASGYVRGEGGGVVVLRRLGDALRAGDRIYCVIRGSSVNNDGPSNGLTAPSPAAQEAALRMAYETAGIPVKRVGYVEAHGTGTFLGDTIEARSLGAVLGCGRAADRPLLVGSIKSNIGHLEAASGIAGLIKAALAIHHRAIPPSLHSRPPNPDIPFEALGLRVPAELVPWPEEGGHEPVAGVNSFGFGGTNCHVVLEGVPRAPELFTAQASGEEALREEARRAVRVLSGPGVEPTLARMCAGTAGAAGGAHRLAVTARSREELRAQLVSFLKGGQSTVITSAAPAPAGGLVFVFSGHGGQWQGMGRDLLRRYPVFRAAVERCDAALRRWTEVSVMDELLAGKEESRLDVFDVAQTTLFAVQVGLAELWRSLGATPDRVVGHSVGEVAAACFAGVLDLDEAARVIFHRSRLGGRNTGTGGMLAVDLPFEEAAKLGARHGDRFCVGVVNSPSSSVLSGDLEAIEAVALELAAAGIRATHVNTSRIAGHCPHMEPLRAELVASLAGLSPRAGEVPIVSTVTAGRLEGGQWGAEYWGRNLRDTVLFGPAIERLAAEGFSTFLEIGPHPVVSHAVKATLAHHGRAGRVIASQSRGDDGAASLLRAAGELFTAGQPLARMHGERDPGDELLLLSAHTEAAVRDLAVSTAGALEQPGAPHLRDTAFTAAVRRDHFPHRLAIVAGSRAEAAEALRRAAPCAAAPAGRPRVGLFFPDACETSRELLRPMMEYNLFRDALERAERALGRAAGATSPFPVQVALAALVAGFAGAPAVVSGEGAGRAAAAFVTGTLDLDAAADLARSGRDLEEGAPPAERPTLWLLAGRDSDLPPGLAELRGGTGAVLSLQGDGRGLKTRALEAFGALYVLGARIDGSALHPGGGQVAPLPAYPFQRERYWLSNAGAPEIGAAPALTAPVASILPELLPAVPGERRGILLSFVSRQVRETLGFDAARPLDPGAPIREMGLDSMLAVQLRSRLGRGIERDLPATLLFDYPTIDALAGHLEALAFGAGQVRDAREDAYLDLSTEALAELLSRKLAGALALLGEQA